MWYRKKSVRRKVRLGWKIFIGEMNFPRYVWKTLRDTTELPNDAGLFNLLVVILVSSAKFTSKNNISHFSLNEVTSQSFILFLRNYDGPNLNDPAELVVSVTKYSTKYFLVFLNCIFFSFISQIYFTYLLHLVLSLA